MWLDRKRGSLVKTSLKHKKNACILIYSPAFPPTSEGKRAPTLSRTLVFDCDLELEGWKCIFAIVDEMAAVRT